MHISSQTSSANALRQAQRLQLLTVVWMTSEASIAIASAWSARSPALLGFGGDSAIELLSAIVVLWRFRCKSESARTEKAAALVAGILLLLVAVVVLLNSVLALFGYEKPRPTLVGIVLLVVAALGMPWLAKQKHRLATQLSATSLKADAAQSAVCGYLAWIALAGLLMNAIFGKVWADPIAGLVLIPFVTREAWEAIRTAGPTGPGSAVWL